MATEESLSATTILSESQRCFSGLSDLCLRLESLGRGNGSGENTQTLASCLDALGRFRVWASHIGAIQQGEPVELSDARFQSSLKLRSTVISCLGRLHVTVDKVLAISSGLVPNRETDMTSMDSDETADSGAPASTELQELLLTVHDLLTHLFSLTRLIRRPRPRGRLLPSVPSARTHSTPDIVNIGDKFPKLKQRPWLLRRLGDATAQRRSAIRYRQTQREDPAQVPTRDDTKTSVTSEPANPTTIVTRLEESSVTSDPVSSGPASSANRHSVLTMATSFNSDFDREGNMGRRIPDLSDMVLNGTRLQYGAPFECPYCRTVQIAKNRLEWKRHVYTDLQPYVCTFEDCRLANTYFESRDEWFHHEAVVHCQRWSCHVCPWSSENRPFSSHFGTEDELRTHFVTKHSNDITASQLQLILPACKVRMSFFGQSSCPFCDEWLNQTELSPLGIYDNSEQFCRHLARHLRQIALDALPIAVEGLEVDCLEKSDSESDSSDDHLSHQDLDLEQRADMRRDIRQCSKCKPEFVSEDRSSDVDCPQCGNTVTKGAEQPDDITSQRNSEQEDPIALLSRINLHCFLGGF